MWDHAHPNLLFFTHTKYVGSLHRNWRFGRAWSHIRYRMPMKLCTWVHPITIYIRAKFQGHPTPNVRSRAPKSPFFTLQKCRSPYVEICDLGRTRSHIRHRMAMKLCTRVHPITIYIRAKFQGHLTPNVRSRAPKSPFFTIRKFRFPTWKFAIWAHTRYHIRHRMAMKLCTRVHAITIYIRA